VQPQLPLPAVHHYPFSPFSRLLQNHRLTALPSWGSIRVFAAAGVRPTESPRALTIPDPSARVALIGFHGLKDRHIPYAGGEGKRTGGLLEFISVEQSLGFWIRENNCHTDPAREVLKEGAVLRASYTCHDHADVVFYTIRDGGHAWPEEGACGRSGDCISATDLIWEFFRAHPKKG